MKKNTPFQLLALTLFFLFLIFQETGFTQSVTWKPSTGTLQKGRTSQIALVFKNCAPQGVIPLPKISELAFGRPNRAHHYDITSGASMEKLDYPISPNQTGTITIPSFTVPTNRGNIKVPAAHFQVKEATTSTRRDGSIPLKSVVKASFQSSKTEIWEGEIIDITYSISIAEQLDSGLGNIDWTPQNLDLEEWAREKDKRELIDGQYFITATFKTRARALKTGILPQQDVKQLIVIQRMRNSRSFFSFPQQQRFTVTTEGFDLKVNPLPQPAPDDFSGAVGSFVLTSKLVPKQVAVEEPITWTLKLEGVGNWSPDLTLPQREVSTDMEVLQPESKLEIPLHKKFSGTLSEDVVLIPKVEGSYPFPSLSYTYFDPQKGTYEKTTTPALTCNVSPASAPRSSAISSPSTSSSSPSTTYSPPTKSYPSFDPTPELPRDPLPGHQLGFPPLSFSFFFGLLTIPLFLLIGLWGFLAHRQARLTDPQLERRLALEQLKKSVSVFQTIQDSTELTTQLRKWQSRVKIFWRIKSPTPTPYQLRSQIESLAPHCNKNSWLTLWEQSEQGLYANHQFNLDHWKKWTGTFQNLISETRLTPQTQLASCFPRNLFPVFFPQNAKRKKNRVITQLSLLFITCLFPVLSFASQETSPTSSSLKHYQSGNFDQAQSHFENQVKESPTNWVARYNLSLTLAQQEKWEKAASHALSAFLLAPRNSTIDWHFKLTTKQAGFSESALTQLAEPSGFSIVSRQLSPFSWQIFIIISFILLTFAVALMLLHQYGKLSFLPSPLISFSWTGLGILSLILLSTGFWALSDYGALKYQNAAIVTQSIELKSIPTDAENDQQTKTVPAGTPVLLSKKLLGWQQIILPNEETGWAREESLISLYR